MRLLGVWLFLAGVAAAGSPAAAWQLEDDLQRRLAGSWAIATTELYSNCAGSYNNNEWSGVGITSGADRRFGPGELVKIDKINLKKKRLDLFLKLGEPILRSRTEGPFELFEEAACKVQLMVGVPRGMTRADNLEGILSLLDGLVELAESKNAAEDSPHWNQRHRRDYPPDYEQTLARHAAWQAEQVNAAVAARSAEARHALGRLTENIRSDPAYLAGFAAAVEDLRYWNETSCDRLLDLDVRYVGSSPPSDQSRDWKDGYEDGKALVVNLHLLAHLEGCRVSVPPVP
jgi:hypothetical protein